jgi:hypothetical protein
MVAQAKLVYMEARPSPSSMKRDSLRTQYGKVHFSMSLRTSSPCGRHKGFHRRLSEHLGSDFGQEREKES